jgi:hypothetical protein
MKSIDARLDRLEVARLTGRAYIVREPDFHGTTEALLRANGIGPGTGRRSFDNRHQPTDERL